MMTKPTFNPVKKTTGATIGYNVRVANNKLRRLQFAITMKKKKPEIRPNF